MKIQLKTNKIWMWMTSSKGIFFPSEIIIIYVTEFLVIDKSHNLSLSFYNPGKAKLNGKKLSPISTDLSKSVISILLIWAWNWTPNPKRTIQMKISPKWIPMEFPYLRPFHPLLQLRLHQHFRPIYLETFQLPHLHLWWTDIYHQMNKISGSLSIGN